MNRTEGVRLQRASPITMSPREQCVSVTRKKEERETKEGESKRKKKTKKEQKQEQKRKRNKVPVVSTKKKQVIQKRHLNNLNKCSSHMRARC